ncbi:hypothetical protein B0A48_16687 [Cryoendolithus antarcticus]|uniref:DUF7704 domain-containing protein n=1 Tax=Cryoendolithus antarcticus TaxID=1507870 RepID=A0A1V8SEK9_9PEZI|nr:hypothetical protein B0A48_16687 [Cryoendolithus antarcticus]
MARSLPIWPFVLIWAYISHLRNPITFYLDHVPGIAAAASPFTPQAEVMLYLLGNVYLLLAALAVICCWTRHRSIMQYYLLVVAFADLGHIYATCRVFGWEKFVEFAQWNDMAWGSIGGSAFLHVNRLATLLGLFGRLK